jgi:hypothetical protein
VPKCEDCNCSLEIEKIFVDRKDCEFSVDCECMGCGKKHILIFSIIEFIKLDNSLPHDSNEGKN